MTRISIDDVLMGMAKEENAVLQDRIRWLEDQLTDREEAELLRQENRALALENRALRRRLDISTGELGEEDNEG